MIVERYKEPDNPCANLILEYLKPLILGIIAPMRRLICLLLLFCLPFQAVGVLAFETHNSHHEDIVHSVAHDNLQAHHHLVDGTIAFDQSEGSSEHLSDHAVYHAVTFAMLLSSVEVFPMSVDNIRVEDFSTFISDRSPDGLLRPPKTIL
ncbi:MAG: hypothetical protein R3194_05180 [Limnobacter sp.]|nr:hypothetical protein [Limnobacter sp.]